MIYDWMKEMWVKILWNWFYGLLGLIKEFGKLLLLILKLIKKLIDFFFEVKNVIE